ncbi:MAG: hypothetical protein HOE48_23125 [Candidatus Latescibacteria bacterium]|jgi:hypothetical protein|nr:hypothetical protein [Candidatus Latescibacterota bacterium]MBT4140823.1 hypothetical protein [Candidatus Latescibacterota bacterium]MBT5828821.1 hypothetical protein [Candidatus Latescibacterota bacterium]
MKDNYPPVLKLLGQRNPTDSDTMLWIAVVLLLLPILLLLGNYLRLYLQRRYNRVRSYDQLEKIAGEKGLSYPEQTTVEMITDTTQLKNPVQLLSSVEAFDRAISTYMKKVETLPWLEMEDQVERILNIRHKVGFRYLSPERPPVSTRELKVRQKIYSLAASSKGIRLIYADIFDINDLAIFTRAFRTSKKAIKLGKKNNIWGFFWSEGGGEYRFKTNLLKEVHRPAHYLLLKHGDQLHHNANREVFVCDQNIQIVAEWISALSHSNTLSPNAFDRIETPETIALSLTHISGSGFGLSFDGRIEVDDLIRIKGADNLPTFLQDIIGRVVKITEDATECRFLNMDAEPHHQLLTHIASNMTIDQFQKRLKVRRTPQKRR